MQLNRPVMMLPIAAAIGLVHISCGESRVSQCNRLTAVINQVDIVTEVAKTGEAAALLEAAAGLDRLAGELRAVEVEDRQLQDLRSRFLGMYGYVSRTLLSTVGALRQQDRQGVESALQLLQQVRGRDRALVKELNDYCTGKTYKRFADKFANDSDKLRFSRPSATL